MFKMFILAIDPAIVNIGVAMLDTCTNKCIMKKVSLLNPTKDEHYVYCESHISYFVSRFLEVIEDLVAISDVVAVEIQMQARMKLVQCAIKSQLLQRKHVCFVAPLSVRKFFGISHGDYAKNKKSSVMFVTKLLSTDDNKILNKHSKKDDVAEAVILAHYVSRNYDKIVEKDTVKCFDRRQQKGKRKIQNKGKRTNGKRKKILKKIF